MAIPADCIPFRVCLGINALTVTMSRMPSADKCEQIVASERRESAVIVPRRTHISAVVARLESNDAGSERPVGAERIYGWRSQPVNASPCMVGRSGVAAADALDRAVDGRPDNTEQLGNL